jgi:hypothetical protein
MPTGPKGQKRPADAIGNAVRIARIATGEEPEELTEDGKSNAAQELGKKGGAARARALTDAQKRDIAKKGADARWNKK